MGEIIMRVVLSAVLALASLCATAADLPSSITGAYLTPEPFSYTQPRAHATDS